MVNIKARVIKEEGNKSVEACCQGTGEELLNCLIAILESLSKDMPKSLLLMVCTKTLIGTKKGG